MHHHRYRLAVGFLAAPLALYVVFVVSPYLQAFYISLTNWQGVGAAPSFVGLANYAELVRDSDVWGALWHNAILLVTLPVLTIGLALFFAFMLNAGGRLRSGRSTGVRGSGLYRVVYFFPYVLSIAIIAVLWQFVYNPRIGLLNGVLDSVGLGSWTRTWLGDPHWALWALLVVLVWNGVGFYVVLFTAGMQSIPADLYEAVLLDGAGRVGTFFRLTLPLLWDTVQTSLVYIGISALDAFAVVAIMTQGGPDGSTEVMSHLLYQTAFRYSQFGYASSMGVLLFFVSMVLAAFTLRFTRRERIEF